MNEGAAHYLDWKDWVDEAFGNFDDLLACYYAAETGLSASALNRVLEIGFGNGSFIGWSHSIGAEVFGVELNPSLVDRCERFLGQERAFADLADERLTALEGTFTHIVAFDVLEHITQAALPAFLQRLSNLLAADGRIIVRFPNGDSPFGRINQHGDPTHVTTIGRMMLVYFADTAGLAVAEIRAPKLPLTGLGFRRLAKRVMLKAGRSLVERILGALYFGGVTVALDPNYTAILRHRTRNPAEVDSTQKM